MQRQPAFSKDKMVNCVSTWKNDSYKMKENVTLDLIENLLLVEFSPWIFIKIGLLKKAFILEDYNNFGLV